MTDGEWPLRRLLSEVVGSGPRSAEDMGRGQAREAMDRILDGDPRPTTLGAFWLANRWKTNTPTELAAFLDVVTERSVRRVEPSADPLDCGANYDGKHTTALLGVAAGVTAAAAGTPVAVHSGDRVPTGSDPAYRHVLDELGVRTALDPAESADAVDEVGFGFYHQPRFNPGIHGLLARRDEMGVRTFLNTVETLVNPAGASAHLGSFYHLSFAKRVIDTLEASETAPAERVVMVQGLEGYDDVRPGETVVAEHDAGGFDDFEIVTADYGLDVEREALAVDDVAADSASITEAVLAGERTDHFRDAVALNAALRIYARGDAQSIRDGLDAATAAIEDGSAHAVLDDLQAF